MSTLWKSSRRNPNDVSWEDLPAIETREMSKMKDLCEWKWGMNPLDRFNMQFYNFSKFPKYFWNSLMASHQIEETCVCCVSLSYTQIVNIINTLNSSRKREVIFTLHSSNRYTPQRKTTSPFQHWIHFFIDKIGSIGLTELLIGEFCLQ